MSDPSLNHFHRQPPSLEKVLTFDQCNSILLDYFHFIRLLLPFWVDSDTQIMSIVLLCNNFVVLDKNLKIGFAQLTLIRKDELQMV